MGTFLAVTCLSNSPSPRVSVFIPSDPSESSQVGHHGGRDEGEGEGNGGEMKILSWGFLLFFFSRHKRCASLSQERRTYLKNFSEVFSSPHRVTSAGLVLKTANNYLRDILKECVETSLLIGRIKFLAILPSYSPVSWSRWCSVIYIYIYDTQRLWSRTLLMMKTNHYFTSLQNKKQN